MSVCLNCGQNHNTGGRCGCMAVGHYQSHPPDYDLIKKATKEAICFGKPHAQTVIDLVNSCCKYKNLDKPNEVDLADFLKLMEPSFKFYSLSPANKELISKITTWLKSSVKHTCSCKK